MNTTLFIVIFIVIFLVCFCVLYHNQIKDFFYSFILKIKSFKIFKNFSKRKKTKNKKEDGKVEPAQFRPIVKPKQIEFSETNKQANKEIKEDVSFKGDNKAENDNNKVVGANKNNEAVINNNFYNAKLNSNEMSSQTVSSINNEKLKMPSDNENFLRPQFNNFNNQRDATQANLKLGNNFNKPLNTFQNNIGGGYKNSIDSYGDRFQTTSNKSHLDEEFDSVARFVKENSEKTNSKIGNNYSGFDNSNANFFNDFSSGLNSIDKANKEIKTFVPSNFNNSVQKYGSNNVAYKNFNNNFGNNSFVPTNSNLNKTQTMFNDSFYGNNKFSNAGNLANNIDGYNKDLVEKQILNKNSSNLSNTNNNQISNYNNRQKENIIEIDGEKFDLNSLPLSLRKMLVSSLLSKKNFD